VEAAIFKNGYPKINPYFSENKDYFETLRKTKKD